MKQKDVPEKSGNTEKNLIKDSFDPSYSNKIQEHLSNVNMDSWFFIYENYVKGDSIEKLNQKENESSNHSS